MTPSPAHAPNFQVANNSVTSTNALTTGLSAPVSLQIITSHDLAMQIIEMTSPPVRTSPIQVPRAANDNQTPVAMVA